MRIGIDDLLHTLEWDEQPRVMCSGPPVTGRWLVLADAGGVGETLAEVLAASGAEPLLVQAGESFARLGRARFSVRPSDVDDARRLFEQAEVRGCHGIVHLWALRPPSPDPEEDLRAACESCAAVFALIRAAADVPVPRPRLWLVTRGAQSVRAGAAPVALAQAPLWGLGRVAAAEHPELWGGLVDLEVAASRDQDVGDLCDGLASVGSEQVYREGRRYVPRLVRWPQVGAVGGGARFTGAATYLVAGALAWPGLRIAHWMVGQGARRLLLTVRPGASDDQTNATLDELRRRGAYVALVEADGSRTGQLADALAQVDPATAPLRGVVCATTVADDRMILQQDAAHLAAVFAPVAEVTWLDRLTRDLALDFFVTCSSAACLLGSPAQASRAAADAFLDALAHQRRRDALPGVNVAWSPHAGRDGDCERDDSYALALGLDRLAPELILAGLEHAIDADVRQVALMRVDYRRYVRTVFGGTPPPVLRALTEHDGPTPSDAPGPALIDRLRAAPPRRRSGLLVAHLEEVLADVTGRAPGARIDPDRGLFELGLDSLGVLLLRNRLQASLGCALPATVAFNHPTVSALADHLVRDVLGLSPLDRTRDEPDDTDGLETMLAQLERLSEEEAEQLLRKSC